MRPFALALVAALSPVGVLAWAAPPAQYTVQDLQKSFAKPAAADNAPDAGAGTCESQGLVTGADGDCTAPKGGSRGFSLVGPEATGSATPGKAAPPARRPSASGASAAPRAPRPTRRAVAPVAPAATHDLLITFANNATTLTEQAKSNAQVFAQAVNTPALRSARFEIDGHTNAVGAREKNLDLSKARADALVDYLASLGVERSRFQVQGFGFDRPLPGTSRTSAENRRVEAKRLN